MEFAHWFSLIDPVPVITASLEDPWFDQNVGDILYHTLKRGKPAVDKWLKGMGSVEEMELEAEQRPQHPAATSHSQQQEPRTKCHVFAADGTCRFDKNCRFSHGAAVFRRGLPRAV